MINTKNILIIGKTGSGKSTLANVITSTNKFKEGEYSVSQTKENQIEETEIEGIKYKVIDTIGIGDTGLTEEELDKRLDKVIRVVKDNVDQILLFFLTKNGKFTEDEIKTYKSLEKLGVTKCTTIVRTHFPGFKTEKKCEEDKKAILRVNGEFGKVIEKCTGVIFVNNSPINIDDDDEKFVNAGRRNHSRNVLTKHLKTISRGEEKVQKQLEEEKEFLTEISPKN